MIGDEIVPSFVGKHNLAAAFPACQAHELFINDVTDCFQVRAHFLECVGDEDAGIEAAHGLLDAAVRVADEIRQGINHDTCQAGRESDFETSLFGVNFFGQFAGMTLPAIENRDLVTTTKGVFYLKRTGKSGTAKNKNAQRFHRALGEHVICLKSRCADCGRQLDELSARHLEHSSALDETEQLVLAYARAMTETPVDVPEGLWQSLRARFDDQQLVELSHTIAWENYRARFNHALGIESEDFSRGAFCVLPERQEA